MSPAAKKAQQPAIATRPAYAPEPPDVKSGETANLLTAIESETWLANRLLDHGCDLYAGSSHVTYGERIRQTILTNGMGCVVVGRRDGKPENYAQVFERMYGLPLEPKAKRKAGGA